MTLKKIRAMTQYQPNKVVDVKTATRNWLRGKANDYPVALTLTLKQTLVEDTDRGRVYRTLQREDCERIVQRFQQKLNRAVLGRRAAEKYGKRLRYLAVLEGERSNKQLHIHMALGNIPQHIRLNQLPSLIVEAKRTVKHIDEEYNVQIADSGWFDYITKETARTHTDNVLWQLMT